MDALPTSESLGNLPLENGQLAAHLLRAYDYARDAQADVWQFAVDIADLMSQGAHRLDLQWLLYRQFAEHARETTIPGDLTRSFRRLPFTSLPDDSCFVLTAQGAESLRAIVEKRSREVPPAESSSPHPASGGQPSQRGAGADPTGAISLKSKALPIWDPNLRELSFQGQVIKRYRVPAPNQELILAAFEEDGWPDWIDDPLPPVPNIEPKRRLQATIKSLNRNQTVPKLRFHVNHNGQIVSWEAFAVGRGIDDRHGDFSAKVGD